MAVLAISIFIDRGSLFRVSLDVDIDVHGSIFRMAPPPPRGPHAMSEKRRWFQYHLLTVLVITGESGLLLGINLRTYKIMSNYSNRACGWPFLWREWYDYDFGGISNIISSAIVWRGLILDLLIAGTIIEFTAIYLEYLIRRRSDRRPPAAS